MSGVVCTLELLSTGKEIKICHSHGENRQVLRHKKNTLHIWYTRENKFKHALSFLSDGENMTLSNVKSSWQYQNLLSPNSHFFTFLVIPAKLIKPS